MGISSVGAVTPQYNAITLTTLATAGGGSQETLKTGRVLVPKGAYTVVMQTIGNVAGGASASLYGVISPGEDLRGTLQAFDADTGRPGATFHTRTLSPSNNDASRPLDNIFVLAKDSFVAGSVYTGGAAVLASQRFQLTLIPTYTPWSALPTVSAATNAVTSSTSTGDVNIYGSAIGWDYDNSAPFIIMFQAPGATTNIPSGALQSSSFSIYRYNTSTNTWTLKVCSSTAGGTNSWHQQNGIQMDQVRPVGYFIKGNYLHVLSTWGVLTDAAGYRYGWIKGDISVAGSSISFYPGHTDTSFANLNSQLGTGSSNIQLYYWDKRNGKVIYNGGQSATFNGTYYPWKHNWAQWDIATNTVEYSNVNGDKDPRIAGSGSYLGYQYGVPDSIAGVTRAAAINGTSVYRATFSRTGVYTGVGNYTTYRAYWSANHTSSALFSSNNSKIEYLDSTYALIDESATTRDFATANYEKIPYTYIMLGYNPGQNQAYYQLLVMPNTIYVLQSAYMKMSTNGDTGQSRMGFQMSIFQAPKNSATLNSIMASGGGIPTTSYVPGINNGSGA